MVVSLNFLPRDLRKALMPFQKDGIRYGIEKNGRCLIGDEMGLGKTLQALSIAYYFKDDWPLLIVVPSSMKYPWVDEIEKWLPEIPPEDINLIKNCSDLTALSKARINILSYGLVSLRSGLNSMLIETVKKANFGVAIVDESHYVKNRQTSRTQRIMQLLKQMKRVILLTGTPSLARPEEINIVRPGLVGNWHNFGERYCDGHYILQTMRGGKVLRKYDTRGASNLKELHEILTKSLMIRRLKCDVLTELPAKRRQRIRFDIVTDSDRKKNLEGSLKHFKKIVSQFKDQLNVLDDARLLTMADVNSAITSLFKNTGLAKAGPIQEYISDLLDAMPNKFVVFCYHLAVIDAVTEVLAKRGTRYIRIAGDVPPEIRANYVREFQTQPYCRVAVLSITAASMGITLTAADHVVFAELHWTPGVIKQAEDRCHRIGQKNAVQIHFLTAKGTIDDVLWSMLSRKLTVTSETLDGEAQLLTADDGDEGKSQLLSLCQAWFPDEDEDDDADLFTPKVKKRDEQRDIRACFVKSAENKKRKIRSYYEKGLVDISDSSDDNQEFKPQHKRGKRRKVLKGSEPVDNKVHQMVILGSSCDEKDATEDLQVQLHHQEGKGDSNEIRKKDFPALETNPLQLNGTKLGHLKKAAPVAEKSLLVDGRPKDLGFRCETTLGSGSEEFLEENLEATGLPSPKVHDASESIHAGATCCKEGMAEQDLEKHKVVVRTSKANTGLQCTFPESTKEKDLALDLCSSNKNEKHTTDEMKKISSPKEGSFGSAILLECDAGSQNAETIYRKETVTSEHKKLISWNCVACTFLNHEDLNTCEMCDTERPKSFVQTRSHSLASDLVAAASEEANSRKPTKSKARNNSAKTRVLENESTLIDIVGKGDQGSQSEDLPSTKAAVILENRGNIASVIEEPSPSKKCFPDIAFSDFKKLSTCTTGGVTQPDQYVDTSIYRVSGLANTVIEANKHAIDTDDKLAPSNSFDEMSNQLIATETAVLSSKSLAKKPGMHITSKHDASDSEVSTITDSSSDAENDWFDKVNNRSCNKRSDLKPRNSREAPRKPFSAERVFTMANDVTCEYYSSLDTVVNPVPTSKKFNECFVDSPLMFSSSADSSNGPEIIESIAIAGFKKDSDLLKQEQLERDRTYDGEGSTLLSASEGTADSNIVNLSSLSDEDSDAAVHLNSSVRGLHETLPHRTGKSPGLDSRISEHEKGDGACEDDTEFLLDGDFDDEISLVSSEKSESEAESEEEAQPVELMFKMSFESDRVYLYNSNEEPFGVNLRIPDLGFLSNDDLPRIFSHPFNLKQLRKLAREWSLLTNTKQRMIRKSGLVFKSPLDVYNRLKEARYGNPSNERFSSKEKRNKNIKTMASSIGGTVAEIKDSKHQRYGNRNQPEAAGKSNHTDTSSHVPNETDPQTLLQAVDSEGDPLCLFCNGKVQNGFKAGTRQARFCSYNCQEEYLFRTSKSRIVRERLFSSEHGICQLCQFDAHQLFARIAALRKKDRKAALEATHFVHLPAASLNKIIADPKEGKFWEADHINAVSEGGGECGLDNYRTLCIPCHRDVTKDLHKRLRHKRKIYKSKSEGIADIEGYFASSNPGPRLRKETKTHNSKDCPSTGTFEPATEKPSSNANGSLSPSESQCMEVFATNKKTSLKALSSSAKALGSVSQKVVKSDEQRDEIYVGPEVVRSMNVKQHSDSDQHASASSTVIRGTGKPIISLKRQPEVSSVNISHAVKSLTGTETTKPAVRRNPVDVACSSKTLQETFTLTSYDNEKNTLASREKTNPTGSNIRSKNKGNELPCRRTTNVNKNLSEPVLPKNNQVPKKAKKAKAGTVNCERSPIYKSAKGTKKSFVEVTEEEMKKSDEKIAALIAKSAENRNHTKK